MVLSQHPANSVRASGLNATLVTGLVGPRYTCDFSPVYSPFIVSRTLWQIYWSLRQRRSLTHLKRHPPHCSRALCNVDPAVIRRIGDDCQYIGLKADGRAMPVFRLGGLAVDFFDRCTALVVSRSGEEKNRPAYVVWKYRSASEVCDIA